MMKPTLCSLAAVVLSVAGSQGAIIIGNLATYDGLDDAIQTHINHTPANPDASPPTNAGYGNKGVGFTMGATAYTVTTLTLRLTDVSGNGDSPTVSIWAGTTVPTTQVGTFTNPASFNGTGTFNYAFTAATSFTLNANVSYFIVVQQLGTTGPDYGFVWANGDSIANNPDTKPTGEGATHTTAIYGGSTSPTGMNNSSLRHNWYQLEGTVVPEPSIPAIAALGFTLLGIRRNRKSGIPSH